MTLLKMALAQYKAMDDDYYGSNMGIWEMPMEDPLNFSNMHRFVLRSTNQPQSVKLDCELRTENRTEEIRNASGDTAYGQEAWIAHGRCDSRDYQTYEA